MGSSTFDSTIPSIYDAAERGTWEVDRDGAKYKGLTPEEKVASEEKSRKEQEKLEQDVGHKIKTRGGVLTSSNPMPPRWKPLPPVGPPQRLTRYGEY